MKFESLLQHIKQKISLTEAEEALIISKLKHRTYLKRQYIVQEDGLFWGVNQTNNRLVTVNPKTWAIVNTFGSIGNGFAGVYDPIRKKYVVSPSNGINVFEADPNAPNYGTALYSFSGQSGADMAYNSADGFIYTIKTNTNDLYRIDIDNQTSTLAGAVNGLPSGSYGACYATFDGRMFFGDNVTGRIYSIDLANSGLNATLFSTGPASNSNDGAKVLGVDLNGNPLCLDTDNDGIINSKDLDSDDDGCPDALEGDKNISSANLINNRIGGTIDSDGVPALATGGQGAGSSYDATVTAGCDEVCGDGQDNDGDGFIDCADSDCQPIISNVAVTQPTCANKTGGEITITAISSSALEYSITNEPNWQSSSTFSNLGIGQYTIRVRNASGCTTEHSNNPVVLDFDTCIEICNNGIDDDSDGQIDCDDADCRSVGTVSVIEND